MLHSLYIKVNFLKKKKHLKIDITKYFLPIFQPLVNDRHRYKYMLGGRAGGKSVFTARKIIYRMQNDGRNNAVIFRQNEKDHSNSTYSELKKAINSFHYY